MSPDQLTFDNPVERHAHILPHASWQPLPGLDAELDPTCEFGIAEERRLRRWLNASVPTAVNNLAEPKPDESRKRRFRELVAPKVTRMGTEALLWPDRAR